MSTYIRLTDALFAGAGLSARSWKLGSQGAPLLSRVKGPTDARIYKVWAATCRVSVRNGYSGSGFFVAGSPGECLVATNAHVIDGHRTATIGWMAGPFMVLSCAHLVAVDYPHDLALLELEIGGDPPVLPDGATCDPQVVERVRETQQRLDGLRVDVLDPFGGLRDPLGPPSPLALGASPSPGDDVLICGYPDGVDSPRLVRGLVSGHAMNEVCGWAFPCEVLDAPVHFGNSGGPICNQEGQVVGVVRAKENPLPLGDDLPRGKRDRDLFDLMAKRMKATSGVGYALEPEGILALLHERRQWRERRITIAEKHEPAVIEMSKEEFVSLQLAWVRAPKQPLNASPIGAFSFSEGQFYLGWSTDEDRIAIDPGAAWLAIARQISQTGGSCFLRGYDVLLYRRGSKAAHFIVPVRVELQL